MKFNNLEKFKKFLKSVNKKNQEIQKLQQNKTILEIKKKLKFRKF